MSVSIKFLPGTATAANQTELTELNFGNIIRGNFAVKDIKIGNVGTSTAESIALSVEGGTSASWKTISTDGGATFNATGVIADIPVNGLSNVISIKSTVPSGASTGVVNSSLLVEYVFV